MRRINHETKMAYLLLFFILAVIIITVALAFVKRSENRKDYNEAKEYINTGKYDEAINLLNKLGNYKDSKELKENTENEKIYVEAVDLLENGDYQAATDKFSLIKDFKDSTDKIREATYYLAVEYYENNDYDSSKKLFVELDNYLDSEFYLAQIDLKNLERSKSVIYANASSQFELENYESALELFNAIIDYKNSKQMAEQCELQIKRKNLNNVISAGVRYSVAITEEGHAIAVGDNSEGQCEVHNWENIVSIDAYGCLTIGLKADKTVEVAGRYDNNQIINTDKWNNIVDVAAGERFVVGLKEDGTLIADGHNDDNQLNVETWKDVIAIDAGWDFTVALTKDKELLFAGIDNGQVIDFKNHKDEWKDVINISASGGGRNAKCRGKGHTVGLNANGTVVAVGDNTYGQCDVSSWKNIIKVVAGDWYTVGLQENGEICITGKNFAGSKYIDEETLNSCNDIVDIAAGFGQTLCITENGTIKAFGFDDNNKRTGTLEWHNLRIPK